MQKQLQTHIEALVGPITKLEMLAAQGATSKVYRFETEQGTFALKSCFKERYRQWLSEEAEVLEKLSNVDKVPAPMFYGFFEFEESSHLITSFEAGVTLTAALEAAVSLDEKKLLVASFGKFLQRLHELSPPPSFETESDWLDRQFQKAQRYIELGQTSGSRELLSELMLTRPEPVAQTMIHGDCTTDNVLVRNGEVVMFIDVAGMTVGDPRYDVALAIGDFHEDSELLEAFYSGYTRFRISDEELRYFEHGVYEFF
ncbi:amino acid transporter [Chryseomicrobium excrementi]|uniref:Amino acid transporter n=1 Tax=Chryseomicrobium excrementi TaxID=2041346 RepID=A0A2M9F0I8_9BACL|nr:phosphotransferase [Chryseomicrobium excrementi]PJK16967.1 amino acid transporter [Chryseomicrobium excrementi]